MSIYLNSGANNQITHFFSFCSLLLSIRMVQSLTRHHHLKEVRNLELLLADQRIELLLTRSYGILCLLDCQVRYWLEQLALALYLQFHVFCFHQRFRDVVNILYLINFSWPNCSCQCFQGVGPVADAEKISSSSNLLTFGRMYFLLYNGICFSILIVSNFSMGIFEMPCCLFCHCSSIMKVFPQFLIALFLSLTYLQANFTKESCTMSSLKSFTGNKECTTLEQ